MKMMERFSQHRMRVISRNASPVVSYFLITYPKLAVITASFSSLLMRSPTCNLLLVLVWSSCCLYANSYLCKIPCKIPPTTLTRRSAIFSSRFIEGKDFIIEDDESDAGIAEDEERELAEIAAKEEKLLTLGIKSQLQSPINSNDQGYSECMQENGVVRINDLLSEELTTRLTELIRSELKESIEDVKNGIVQPLERFSTMLSSTNRWDFKLKLDHPIVLEAMRTMFCMNTPLGTLMTTLVSEKGELFELAAFYTSSGAKRQVVHADTLWSKQPALYTCAIALQDVSEDMGPTLFFPGSNTKAMHKKFDSRKTKDEVLTGHPHVLSTLNKGDMSIYDSRVLHCGTPNRSQKERILMYATFRNPKGPSSDSDFWNVASIRPEYEGKYKLKDFL